MLMYCLSDGDQGSLMWRRFFKPMNLNTRLSHINVTEGILLNTAIVFFSRYWLIDTSSTTGQDSL